MTLIIPCYNQAEFLPDAIESALDQTLPFQEIIVINDGSTDSTAKVAAQYPVKVINQVNKGLASARNTGIMNSTSEYIVFLDADDILMETASQKIQDKIEETHADIIMWDFKEFGIRNERLYLGVPTLEDMKTANRMAYCSAFKRSKLLEVGGYSPRMTYGYEDYHLSFDLMKRGATIAHIPEVLFLYRTKAESMITDAIRHDEELLGQIVKDHKEIFQ